MGGADSLFKNFFLSIYISGISVTVYNLLHARAGSRAGKFHTKSILLCASAFHSLSHLKITMSKLYVGNLPEEVKEKDIRELFNAFGEVEEVAVFRGFAFVVRFV